MTNREVVAVLNEIALLLDLSGESPFKSRAYTGVARQIERLDAEVVLLVEEKGLRGLKGVGDALEQKITELVETGELRYHQQLRAKFPDSLFALFRIPGLGPKRIKMLYDEVGIQSIDALETGCRDGSLSKLKGFGPKLQAKLLAAIALAREYENLFHFDRAWDEASRIAAVLSEESSVVRMEIAGSLRRRREVVKDADLIVSSPDAVSVMKRFVEDDKVVHVGGHGPTKSSVVLQSGLGVDLRVVDDEQFPYALAHFTGSREHNVTMRQRAKERGLKLNEYGLFEGEHNVPCRSEQDLFEALDLPFIPPELREDRGEFDAARIPPLVEEADLVGVFHCHTRYSDGQDSIEEMAGAAQEQGYAYIAITDHSQSAAYAGGLVPSRVSEQQAEIDGLNQRTGSIRILKGIESDILTDGSLDYEEDVLRTFEVIVASVHNKLEMTEDEATARLIRAVENPYTTILGHPTGRLLLERRGFPLNYKKLFDACAANGVAVEINANCHRLDLDWRHVRQAKEKGVKLCIGPDAHNLLGLENISHGIGIARKGWLEKEDLLNCMTAESFLSWRR